MNVLATSILLCCVGICYSEFPTPSWPGLMEPSAFIQILEQASQFSARSKRQTNATTRHLCTVTSLVAQCNSGRSQGVANTYAQCGRNDLAAVFANRCARGEMGQLCAEISLEYSRSLGNVFRFCNESAQSTFASCSSVCSSSLRTFRHEWGCCINSVVNMTTTESKYKPFYSSDLWSRCGVEPVGTCSNIPSFIPRTRSPPCSDRDAVQSVLSYACTQTSVQPVLNALAQIGSRCQIQANALVNECAVRGNGEYCGVDTLPNSTLLSDLIAAESMCTDRSFCYSRCKTAILRARENSGCCLNTIYNSSLFPIRITSYEVWNSCRVTSPGFCPNTVSAGKIEPVSDRSRSERGVVNVFTVIAMATVAFKLLYR